MKAGQCVQQDCTTSLEINIWGPPRSGIDALRISQTYAYSLVYAGLAANCGKKFNGGHSQNVDYSAIYLLVAEAVAAATMCYDITSGALWHWHQELTNKEKLLWQTKASLRTHSIDYGRFCGPL